MAKSCDDHNYASARPADTQVNGVGGGTADSTPCSSGGSQVRMDSRSKRTTNNTVEVISDDESDHAQRKEQVDPLRMAMEVNQLEFTIQHDGFVAAFETVDIPPAADPTQATKSIGQVDPEAPTLPISNGNPDEVKTPDEDRQVEDALELIQNSTEDVKNLPEVKAVIDALKRSQKSNAAKDKRISSLLRLAMAAENKLKAFLQGEARDISESLKRAFDDSKKDIIKSLKQEVTDSITSMTNKNLEQTNKNLEQTNSSLANLAAKMIDLNLSSKKIMEATTIVDQKLSASGLVLKDNDLEQVDVPEVLLQINKKVNGTPFAFPPPPVPSFPIFPTQDSNVILQGSFPPACPPPFSSQAPPIHSKMTPKVGLSKTSTPKSLHPPATSSSSLLTPSTTPRKQGGRWDQSRAPSNTTNSISTSKPNPARSLTHQMNSCVGFTSANNPKLFKDMSDAMDYGYSQEQIEKRANQYEKELRSGKRQRDA